MINYATARRNMVDSQIHTNGVVETPVLEAFRTIPRELFVPDALRGLAYVDEDLPLGDGRTLMEPALLAKMISAADVRADDIVLNIGDMTGYSSAVLSTLATTVVTLEFHPGILDGARQVWANESYCNIALINGDSMEGCPEHAPYTLIFLNGAVAEIPDIILAQLSLNGRLIGVHQPAGAKIGTVTLTERVGEEKYATRKLFNAATPFIPGFAPRQEFVF